MLYTALSRCTGYRALHIIETFHSIVHSKRNVAHAFHIGRKSSLSFYILHWDCYYAWLIFWWIKWRKAGDSYRWRLWQSFISWSSHRTSSTGLSPAASFLLISGRALGIIYRYFADHWLDTGSQNILLLRLMPLHIVNNYSFPRIMPLAA